MIWFDSVIQFDPAHTENFWITVSNLTQIFRLNLNQHLRYSFISVFNSTWLSFTIWFDYHYIHPTRHFQFESDFLIQFGSSYPLQFHSYFLIKFDSFIQFYLTHTTRLQITISDFNQLLKFNLTCHLQFNFDQNIWLTFTQFSIFLGLILHPFD